MIGDGIQIGHEGAAATGGTPRFSVHLRALGDERERAESAARAADPAAPAGRTRWPDLDRFEPAAEPVGCDCDLGGLRKGAPERETVERTRITLTSPAGRFFDLLA